LERQRSIDPHAKTDGSPTYTPGVPVTYTITVTNAGPSAVIGATVSDILPAGTSFVSAAGGATYDSGSNTVRYTTGALGVSGSTSFTITILPASTRTGSLVNTATVAAPTGTTDSNPLNNSAIDTDTPAPVADLSISKTDNRTTYVPDRNLTYTITVTNLGPSAVTGATVSDVLPAGTSFVSATGGAMYDFESKTVRYTAGTIGVLGSASFTLTILPAATRTDPLVNTATVAPPSGVTDPTTGNNSATDTDTLAPPQDPVILAISDVGCESTPVVTVIEATSGTVRRQFQAFETSFRGGLRAALGDLDNDGIDEIVVAPGLGRMGEIRVFTLEGVERTSFRLAPFGATYRDGIDVAVGDINGDGLDDVVAAKSRGAGDVAILPSNGSSLRMSAIFAAFGGGFLGGATVAVADMGTFVGGTDRTRPDGRAEVIVGSGIGMAPTVMVFDVSGSPRVVDSFRPLSAAYQAGFSISAQRINADRIPDLLIAAGRSSSAAVEVYDGATKARIAMYGAFASLARPSAKVYAAAADLDGDGWADEAYMTQGTGVTTAGVQQLRVQSPNQATTIATSLRAPLRVVTRGPRRLAA
ncbi:MAG: FG-GAP-like repeat-containing protein, partial [Planctomycetia bacterium]